MTNEQLFNLWILIVLVAAGVPFNGALAASQKEWLREVLTRKGRIAVLVLVAFPWLFAVVAAGVALGGLVMREIPGFRAWIDGKDEASPP